MGLKVPSRGINLDCAVRYRTKERLGSAGEIFDVRTQGPPTCHEHVPARALTVERRRLATPISTTHECMRRYRKASEIGGVRRLVFAHITTRCATADRLGLLPRRTVMEDIQHITVHPGKHRPETMGVLPTAAVTGHGDRTMAVQTRSHGRTCVNDGSTALRYTAIVHSVPACGGVQGTVEICSSERQKRKRYCGTSECICA
jgi:hypothetical protein